MKILVAVSGTHLEDADPIAAAAAFPWPAGSEFRVLSVAQMVQVMAPGPAPALPDMVTQMSVDDTARQFALDAAERLRHLGYPVEAVAMEGAPEAVIVEYAAQWAADLIVLGSRDRSRVERFLLGSVSQSVVAHAPCSLLVVKHSLQ
ncbi:MAG TPA: universal stress protein [Candidatus Sulfopaludibacter sp.]|jgi:nucleotide-binding universal stress UspA family protein|nr:universal stress protein [Candidatus Sulfopaludibacter sp.]